MQSTDTLIKEVYGTAAHEDWRTARERSLQLVAQHVGARTAAWFTHGEAGKTGPYTEMPRSGFTRSQLAVLKFADGAWLSLPGNGLTLAFRHRHQASNVISVLAFRWPGQAGDKGALKSTVQNENLTRLVAHLAEASALSMKLFVQRDEWLMSMGRASRGAAALVDAQGWIYAATDRFVATMEDHAEQPLQTCTELPFQLPFQLPPDVQDVGGAFARGGMHLRVEHMDGLYLMHARKPLPLDVLSPRELQIAQTLGRGKTFKSVASQCGIAVSTVANHATRIYRKLGIFRREELMEMLRSPGAAAAARAPRKARQR